MVVARFLHEPLLTIRVFRLTWQDQWTPPTHCPECNAELTCRFCSNCGQKNIDHRLNFYEILCDLVSRITSLERGLLHTFIQLCLRPGIVAREYVHGKQRRYANPLTYFFLGVAAQLAAVWLMDSQMRVHFDAQMREQSGEIAFQRLNEIFAGNAAEVIKDAYLGAIQQAYLYCVILFFCLPFSLLVLGGQRLIGEKFTWGEVSVFTLYMFGHVLMFTALFSLLSYRYDMALQLYAATFLYLLLPQHAHTHFFRGGWLSRGITFIATSISMVLLILSISGVFTASVVWAIVSRNAANTASQSIESTEPESGKRLKTTDTSTDSTPETDSSFEPPKP